MTIGGDQFESLVFDTQKSAVELKSRLLGGHREDHFADHRLEQTEGDLDAILGLDVGQRGKILW